MSTTPDDRLVDGESADEQEKDAEATRGVGGSERAGGPSAGSDAEADLPDEARRAIDELVAEATSRRKGRGALGVVAVAAAFVLAFLAVRALLGTPARRVRRRLRARDRGVRPSTPSVRAPLPRSRRAEPSASGSSPTKSRSARSAKTDSTRDTTSSTPSGSPRTSRSRSDSCRWRPRRGWSS